MQRTTLQSNCVWVYFYNAINYSLFWRVSSCVSIWLQPALWFTAKIGLNVENKNTATTAITTTNNTRKDVADYKNREESEISEFEKQPFIKSDEDKFVPSEKVTAAKKKKSSAAEVLKLKLTWPKTKNQTVRKKKM